MLCKRRERECCPLVTKNAAGTEAVSAHAAKGRAANRAEGNDTQLVTLALSARWEKRKEREREWASERSATTLPCVSALFQEFIITSTATAAAILSSRTKQPHGMIVALVAMSATHTDTHVSSAESVLERFPAPWLLTTPNYGGLPG